MLILRRKHEMTLMKCPRCDLNYITPDQKYCKVCLREMKGEGGADEVELCSICNEAPALPGKCGTDGAGGYIHRYSSHP